MYLIKKIRQEVTKPSMKKKKKKEMKLEVLVMVLMTMKMRIGQMSRIVSLQECAHLGVRK